MSIGWETKEEEEKSSQNSNNILCKAGNCMQNLAYPFKRDTRKRAQEQRHTQPLGDPLAANQQPSGYHYGTRESSIKRPPPDHCQEQIKVHFETIMVIPHAPNHKQFWNVDDIEPKQRLAYIEQFFSWGKEKVFKILL